MSRRQLAMVMDLNKCIGCQTCTVACKTQWTNRNGRDYMYWNNVETRPGKGYPRNWDESGGGWEGQTIRPGVIPPIEDYGVPWDYNYEDALMKDSGSHLKPIQGDPKWGPNWDEEQGAGEFPNSYYFYLPRICNHCTNPSCLAACKNKAIYKREQDGIVLIDQDRCRGNRDCLEACPYKKIYYNIKTGTSEKCIFCFPRIEQGLPPACAQQCVGRIRHVGFLDDEESHVHKLVVKHKVALPLRPDYGTQPNVYYVPIFDSSPTFNEAGEWTETPRVPMEVMEHYFGPTVREVVAKLKEEKENHKTGKSSELIDILIAYRHQDMFSIPKPEPAKVASLTDFSERRREQGNWFSLMMESLVGTRMEVEQVEENVHLTDFIIRRRMVEGQSGRGVA